MILFETKNVVNLYKIVKKKYWKHYLELFGLGVFSKPNCKTLDQVVGLDLLTRFGGAVKPREEKCYSVT